MDASLPKAERLHGKTAIAALVGKGRWIYSSHLRCCFLSDNGAGCNRIMVSVPKRNFKRAVKRNLLKRRMRESYRTQKQLLTATSFDLLFIYTEKTIADSAVIRTEMADILSRLSSGQ